MLLPAGSERPQRLSVCVLLYWQSKLLYSKLSTKTHLDACLLRAQACVCVGGCHALEVCGALVAVPPPPPIPLPQPPPKSVTPPPLLLAHSPRPVGYAGAERLERLVVCVMVSGAVGEGVEGRRGSRTGGGLSLSVPSPLLLVRPLSRVYRARLSQAATACVSACQHTSACIRQHAYVSIRQHTSAYVSIRQHTSAHVSTRQHTSAHVSCTTFTRSDCAPRARVTYLGTAVCLCACGGGSWRVQDALAIEQSSGLQV